MQEQNGQLIVVQMGDENPKTCSQTVLSKSKFETIIGAKNGYLITSANKGDNVNIIFIAEYDKGVVPVNLWIRNPWSQLQVSICNQKGILYYSKSPGAKLEKAPLFSRDCGSAVSVLNSFPMVMGRADAITGDTNPAGPLLIYLSAVIAFGIPFALCLAHVYSWTSYRSADHVSLIWAFY